MWIANPYNSMKDHLYTPEEIDKRIESIRYVLALPPNVISLNAEVRKDCEDRLAELEKLKVKPQDVAARLSESP